MTQATQATQMTQATPTTQPPSQGTLWSALTSASFLFVVLLGGFFVWGSQVLVGWWGTGLSPNLQGWLHLLPLCVLCGWIGHRLFGAQLARWLLAFLLITGLLNVAAAIKTTGTPLPANYQTILGAWRELLVWLNLATPQLFLGLLFFALLARMLELASLLWFPQTTPLPALESTTQETIPLSLKDKPQDALMAALTKHISTPVERAPGQLWAERGRGAALGELWLLLGGIVALGGIVWIALSPQTMRWTRLLLGVAPWIAIGALLRTGEPFSVVCAQITKDEDDDDETPQLLLWTYSPHHTHDALVTPLLASLNASDEESDEGSAEESDEESAEVVGESDEESAEVDEVVGEGDEDTASATGDVDASDETSAAATEATSEDEEVVEEAAEEAEGSEPKNQPASPADDEKDAG